VEGQSREQEIKNKIGKKREKRKIKKKERFYPLQYIYIFKREGERKIPRYRKTIELQNKRQDLCFALGNLYFRDFYTQPKRKKEEKR